MWLETWNGSPPGWVCSSRLFNQYSWLKSTLDTERLTSRTSLFLAQKSVKSYFFSVNIHRNLITILRTWELVRNCMICMGIRWIKKSNNVFVMFCIHFLMNKNRTMCLLGCTLIEQSKNKNRRIKKTLSMNKNLRWMCLWPKRIGEVLTCKSFHWS